MFSCRRALIGLGCSLGAVGLSGSCFTQPAFAMGKRQSAAARRAAQQKQQEEGGAPPPPPDSPSGSDLEHAGGRTDMSAVLQAIQQQNRHWSSRCFCLAMLPAVHYLPRSTLTVVTKHKTVTRVQVHTTEMHVRAQQQHCLRQHGLTTLAVPCKHMRSASWLLQPSGGALTSQQLCCGIAICVMPSHS
jgi:hypothetical protein